VTRIGFTADLHVDEYGSRRDPATGLNARLVDYLETVRFVSTQALARGCDALVIAGDFTERRHPAPWLVGTIQDALEECPPELIIVRGNHDGEIAGASIVTVMGYGLNTRGWQNAFARPGVTWVKRTAIAAIPYLDRHWLRTQPGFEDVPESQLFAALAEQYMAIARGLYAEAYAKHPDPDGVVLVCHQTLAGAHLSASQQAFLGDQQLVIDAADLGAIGFEGIVAGHLHRHQVLSTDPPILYTGSVERVDFGEQDEVKGFVIAEVGPGRFEWEFVETPARRYVTLTGTDPIPPTVNDAIVRGVDLDPAVDLIALREDLGRAGAFEVAELRHRPGDDDVAGGMSESLSAEEALVAYFADDPEADALIERGRAILAEVGS